MDIQTLTTFFMWCTIINGGIFLLWTVLSVFAPDLVYRMQSKWFPMPREIFNVAIYSFHGFVNSSSKSDSFIFEEDFKG